ncbi:DUF2232 domain-containing protein [Peptoniphilus mikwangii]|uniref:DUF2232 domain-containing protein n=1 Tax=Peptoniphilus mikwangii TaxID=1354300 RepID=UPI000403F5FB|nr:DUF2232 domain-containing protein [Peptoniphilus mikwangii]
MVKINKSKNNIYILIIKSILITLGGLAFPLLYIFLPAIFLTEAITEGIIKIMGIFIGLCILVSILISPIAGILVLNLFGPIVLVYHYMISNKYEVNTTIIVAAGTFFLSMIMSFYFLGITPELLKSQDVISKVIELQREIFNSEQLSEFSKAFNESEILSYYNRSLQIMPAMMVCVSLIISYLTYVISGRTLLKRGGYISQPSSFIFFKVPKEFVIVGVFSLILIYFMQDVFGVGYLILMENILIVFSLVLFFAGLSLLQFFMVKIKANKFSKIIVTVVTFMFPTVQIILVVIGFVDSILNFRKLP